MKQKEVGLYLLVLLGGILLFLKILMLLNSKIMLDEFQHLHAAWYIFEGNTPYVDFFEHHPPFLYYLLQPVFEIFPANFQLIIWARFFMLALQVSIFWLVYAIAKNGFGKPVAALAVILALSEVLFFEHGFKILTDVPATVFSLLMVLSLQKSIQKNLRWNGLLAGFYFGVAVLFTPKVIFLGIGMFIWVWAFFQKDIFKILSWIGAGGVLSIGVLIVLIGPYAVPAFWEDCVILNLGWKARHSPISHIRHMMGQNAPFWAAAAMGTVYFFYSKINLTYKNSKGSLIIIMLICFGLGAIMIPVVWTEYFVGVVPYGAMVAAWVLHELWLKFNHEKGLRAEEIFNINKVYLAGAGVIFLGLIYTLKSSWMWEDLDIGIAIVVFEVVLACLLVWFLIKGKSLWVQVVALLMILSPPLWKQCHLVQIASNKIDQENVSWIEETVSKDGYIFDGYTGYGVFRKHAYTYWFLHEEVQLMLDEQEMGEGVIEALERNKPQAVVYDHYIQSLPDTVQVYLKEKYRPSEFPLLWVLKNGGEIL